MCLLKPVKHYFIASASLAEWLEVKTDSRTTRVRVSWAAMHFRQMHEMINIFDTVLVQNIENGKLHRQVDSVDAGLNRDSQFFQCGGRNWMQVGNVFFSVWGKLYASGCCIAPLCPTCRSICRC